MMSLPFRLAETATSQEKAEAVKRLTAVSPLEGKVGLATYQTVAERKDLEPMEKARGLSEVYKLSGFEPLKVKPLLQRRGCHIKALAARTIGA